MPDGDERDNRKLPEQPEPDSDNSPLNDDALPLSTGRNYDPHELPTMPLILDDSGDEGVSESEPNNALPGTGGMDPNSDLFGDQPALPFDGDNTMPNRPISDHTVQHNTSSYSRKTQPPKPSSQNTVTSSQPYAQSPSTMPSSRPPVTQPPGQSTMPSNRASVPPQGARTVSQNTQPMAASQRTAAGAYQQPYVPPAPPAPPPGQRTNVSQEPALPRRKPQKRTILGFPAGCVTIFLALFASFCGGLTLITVVAVVAAGTRVEQLVQERIALVDDYQNFESTFFYDRNGQVLYETFGEGRRTNVDYTDFPQDLINATVAIEDDTFFSNPGIEVEATGRAFLQYVGLYEGSSGGSTITQQVVRNVLFDFEYRSERSVTRKLEEILLALALKQRKNNEEILELYLNEIYYGSLAYGAEAASQVFFNKHVNELTLGEAALLAGLPQFPAEYNPLDPDPEVQAAVSLRWRTVLDRMVEEGYITDAQRNETLRQGLTFSSADVPLNAPHFTVYAQTELERLMGELGYSPEDVARGGLRIFTTVDLRINQMAQQAARDQIARLSANQVSNAAVLVMTPLTGEILAMVGSVDYDDDSIDGRVNVAISLRQPGSTMKPFTYSAALEAGMTAGDVIWDTPTTIGIPGQPGYTPRNYDGAYHGPVTMRTALANSYNIPAVQTLRRVGVESLLALMRRFGVESFSEDASVYGLSLTLGGGEISLLELTQGYTVFANGGTLVRPTSILCIVNSDDEIIYEYENSCPGEMSETSNSVSRNGLGTQVLDPRIAFLMSDIMADNAARTPAMGANSPLNTGGLITSVKTGTTNDVKDNWTVGYTRNVAVGVWVGNSRGEPMVNSSGLTGAAPIWNAVITGIYGNNDLLAEFAVDGQLQQDQLQPPPGMSYRRICDIRTLRDPATDCAASFNEWFLDSPAAIADGAGNLEYPPATQPPDQNPPQAGPWLIEADPGVYRVLAQPIDPNLAAAITFPVQAGQPQPLPPLYCQVPIEVAAEAQATGARELLFIAPPADPADAVQAEQYARNNGLAFLPTIACTMELLVPGGFGGGSVVTALIQQPAPGQVVTEGMPIIGTVQWAPGQAQYYKLEIQGGQFPDWVTIGSIHSENVVNGALEILPGPPGLQPGGYQLRLAVVGNDGNYIQEPYVVPFSVP